MDNYSSGSSFPSKCLAANEVRADNPSLTICRETHPKVTKEAPTKAESGSNIDLTQTTTKIAKYAIAMKTLTVMDQARPLWFVAEDCTTVLNLTPGSAGFD